MKLNVANCIASLTNAALEVPLGVSLVSMRETLLEAAVRVAILVFLLATRVAAEGGLRLVRLIPPTGDLMRRPRWPKAARLFLVLLWDHSRMTTAVAWGRGSDPKIGNFSENDSDKGKGVHQQLQFCW